MRVLETNSNPAYKMGKSKNKKHRIRKNKDADIGASDSSDDGLGTLSGCPHINKAVNFAAMRKAILKVPFGQCVGCVRDGGAAGAAAAATEAGGAAEGGDMDAESETTVWVCLQCGHQGCDRNSQEKHALKHFETPHSGAHCIVLNLSSWIAWCYSCDDFIPLANSRRIQECGEFLRNKAGLPKLDLSQPSTPAGPSRRPPPPTASKTESGSAEQQAVSRENRTANNKAPACQKVKGLNNLGNTCFFNAVMQNLSQTPNLEALLVERTRKSRTLTLPGRTLLPEPLSIEDFSDDASDSHHSLKDVPPIEIALSDTGPLTVSLLGFMQEMNNASSRGATVNPDSLFKLICKKAPRFKGFQQQDSHELLHYLLDAVKNEEIKRGQSGILKHFKLPENVNPRKVDDDVKIKIKEYGKQAKHTFLDSLLGGQLVSTVMCEECKHISQVFEPFLDLSLPVTEEKPIRPNQGRRREGLEGEELAGGDPVLATRWERPSKHSEKKNKKQARKAAKRRAKMADHQTSGLSGDSGEPSKSDALQAETAGQEEEEEEDDEVEAEGGAPGHGRKEELDGNESNSSQREDPSDADVEDNVESESARLMGLALLDDSPSGSLPSAPPSLKTTEDGSMPSVADSGVFVSPESDTISGSSSLMNHMNGKVEELDGVGNVGGGETLAGSKESGLFDEGKVKEEGCNDGPPSNEVSEDDKKLLEQMANLNLGTGETTELEVNSAAPFRANGVEENGADESAEQEPFVNGREETNREETDPAEIDQVREETEETRDLEASGNTSGHDLLGDDANNCSTHANGDAATHSRPSSGGQWTADSGGAGRLGNSRRVELEKEAQLKSMGTLGQRYQPSNMECSVSSCLNQFTSAELLTGHNRVCCPNCTRLQQHNSSKDKNSGEKVYSNASKQYLIFSLPAVLTLHLKRFEQVGFASRKVNRHVEFPLLLDLAPYSSSLCQGAAPGQTRLLYSLYGIVEHSGKLTNGHYTAYIKVRPNADLVHSFMRPCPQQPEDYIHHYVEQALLGQTPGAVHEQPPSEETINSLVPPGRWYHVSDCRVSETQEAQVLRAQAYLLFYERIY